MTDATHITGFRQIIVHPTGTALPAIGIDENQLHLHAGGNHALDINRRTLSDAQAVTVFGKSRKIRCQLDKHPVGFHTAHNTRDGLTG